MNRRKVEVGRNPVQRLMGTSSRIDAAQLEVLLPCLFIKTFKGGSDGR